MKEIAEQIREVINSAIPVMHRITEEEAEKKISPESWSKKEIVGHLIDSAANNHQRFVRAAYNSAHDFPPYNQNEWVRIQHYQELVWLNLLMLWEAYNYHLCDIIERLPEGTKNSSVNIGGNEAVTLEFVIKDYLRHLIHHIQKIIN